MTAPGRNPSSNFVDYPNDAVSLWKRRERDQLKRRPKLFQSNARKVCGNGKAGIGGFRGSRYWIDLISNCDKLRFITPTTSVAVAWQLKFNAEPSLVHHVTSLLLWAAK